MDNKKVGCFISELRKEKNMTQKELAEKLNVTDKAVSKWERGIGYPEITTAPILAELLDVSLSELLLGERINNQKNTEQEEAVTADAIASSAIEYAEQSFKQKATRITYIAFVVMSVAFLIGLFVSFLCNFVISGKFDWSLYVLGSEVTVWMIASPLLILKKHRCTLAMAGLTVSIMPLLFLIDYLCPVKGWVIPFALPIVVISVASLWVSVILFVYTKIGRLYLAAFEFILYGVILNSVINSFVSNYLKSGQDNISVPIVAISSGFVAVVLVIFAILKGNKKY